MKGVAGLMMMALTALFVVTAGVAHAATASEDLIRRGVEARRHRNDAEALELFKQAYADDPNPRAAAQIGLAEIALGRWLEAETHLSEAVAARSDAWIHKNMKALADSLARAREQIGSLEVLGTPAGTEVVIGGEVKGTLPLSKPIHVRAGDVRFELRARGYLPDTRSLRVAPGQLMRESVNLLPAPSAPASGPVASSPVSSLPRPLVVKSPPPEAPDEPLPSASRPGAGLRITGILLASAGVVALAGGLAFGLKARSASTADSQAPTYDSSVESTGLRYEKLQWIGYGVGAGLIAAGVTTYLIGASRSQKGSAIEVAPTPGGGMATFLTAF